MLSLRGQVGDGETRALPRILTLCEAEACMGTWERAYEWL
jgi:hypothetical protein